MLVSQDTRIAFILKHRPDALEAIISISPKFAKLRNPLLRKIMAGKTSVAMACKIAGCSIDIFYDKLKPFGFEFDEKVPENQTAEFPVTDAPAWLVTAEVIELDVRPMLESGSDPFKIINQQLLSIAQGQCLKIINTFEPVPLIAILAKQGYESYTKTLSNELVWTWFFNSGTVSAKKAGEVPESAGDWHKTMLLYKDKLNTIDVRQLEMPAPMIAILDQLERLPGDMALFVYHKRIPLFLLPELNELGFDYRAIEISEGEVRMIIFRP